MLWHLCWVVYWDTRARHFVPLVSNYLGFVFCDAVYMKQTHYYYYRHNHHYSDYLVTCAALGDV